MEELFLTLNLKEEWNGTIFVDRGLINHVNKFASLSLLC